MPELEVAEMYIEHFAFVWPADAVWAFLQYPRLKAVLKEVGLIHYYSTEGTEETWTFGSDDG